MTSDAVAWSGPATHEHAHLATLTSADRREAGYADNDAFTRLDEQCFGQRLRRGLSRP